MASSRPIVRQINISLYILQFVIVGIIMFLFYLLNFRDSFLLGLITYLLISILAKQVIPKDHRQGVRLYKHGQYEKAVSAFQKSYEFFNKHKWIDKYRALVLFSVSRMSYTEMALLNMAFCYSQLGEGKKSKGLYEKVLKEFPDSQMADSALKMFDAAKNID